MESLTELVLEYLKPGDLVLDLGAGVGRQARELAEAGLRVVAVERFTPKIPPVRVEWHEAEIMAWLSAHQHDAPRFDAVILRHVVQFFTKRQALHHLLPRVGRLVKPGGLVAVETFAAPPEPPFSKKHSYYSESDIMGAFPRWVDLVAGWRVVDDVDFEGTRRTLEVVQLLLRRRRVGLRPRRRRSPNEEKRPAT